MSQYPNICILYYSELLSLPGVGNVVYVVQSLLLNCGILKIFLASGKNSKERKVLFKQISQKFNWVDCRSHLFARELQFLEKSKPILNTPYIKRPNKLSKEELYNLMWALVFCKFVTKETKDSLVSFLPTNYPVFEKLL